MRKLSPSSFTPYIYSDAELKRLLKAVPLARGPRADIDGETFRALLLLLYGAGLRRREGLHLKLSDFDGLQSLIHVRATKFFLITHLPQWVQ
jgi:integrase